MRGWAAVAGAPPRPRGCGPRSNRASAVGAAWVPGGPEPAAGSGPVGVPTAKRCAARPALPYPSPTPARSNAARSQANDRRAASHGSYPGRRCAMMLTSTVTQPA